MGSAKLFVIFAEKRELDLLDSEEKYISSSPEADNVSWPESPELLAASLNTLLLLSCLFSPTESRLKISPGVMDLARG